MAKTCKKVCEKLLFAILSSALVIALAVPRLGSGENPAELLGAQSQHRISLDTERKRVL